MRRFHRISTVAAFLLLASRSLAAVIHVPGDYATIQEGIDAAMVGDVVEVACGTYAVPEIIMKSGVTLRSETGTPDCVIVEPIDPQASERKLLRSNAAQAILGITFRNGASNDCGVVLIEGAGALSDCIFSGNRGRFNVAAERPSRGLSDPCYSGAAIVFRNATAVVTNCQFLDNRASGSPIDIAGAGLFIDCMFADNSAGDGSGGAVTSVGATFLDCVFSGNRAYFNGGSVVAADSEFNSCVFFDNEAGIRGGAMFICGSRILSCLFSSNYAGWLPNPDGALGGAVYIRGYSCSVTEVVTSSLYGNVASPPRAGASPDPIRHTTPVGRGSAIYVEATAQTWMSLLIVGGNTGSEAIYCEPGSTIGIACSNVFGNPGGDWTGCIEDQLGVNGNIAADPMFCNAASANFHLSSLSPCLYSECGVMGAFGQGCFDERPALYHVRDVGNDQGRQVRLSWQRSQHDSPTANPYVTGYGIYRKREQFRGQTPSDQALSKPTRADETLILGWDYLMTIPSRGDSVYETVVPTLCDSTITNGQCLSTFFVSAATTSPFVYYDSPPRTGYSLDNLAPPTPTGFSVAYNTGSGNRLEWHAVAAPDFAGFNVYRFTQAHTHSSTRELVATTTQTHWTDPDYDGWSIHYEVTSFDVAGNESAAATAGATTAVPSPHAMSLDLFPNFPNPFNPTTHVPFRIPAAGPVRVTIHDARGRLVRVLVDKTLPSGHHEVVWDGRDRAGSAVTSGVYLARLENAGRIRARKIVLIK